MLFPSVVYDQGVSRESVVANFGYAGDSETIFVYVVSVSRRGHATLQGGSRHHYTPHHWCFPEIREGITRTIHPMRSQVMIDAARSLVMARKPLRIALVELPEVVHDARLKPQPNVESRWLSNGPVADVDKKIQQAVLLAIRRARSHGAHVVLFGELCGSAGVSAALISEIQRTDWRDNPILVVGPTRHEVAADGTVRNICRALDAQGNFVDELTHAKINWVSLSRLLGSVPLEEAITPGTGVSLLATEFGLVAIVICHDLSQAIESRTLLGVLADLPLCILFVPSMSKRTDAHKRASQFVNLENAAHVVVANQALVKFWEGDTTAWDEGGSFWWRGEPNDNPLPVEVFRYRVIESAGNMSLELEAAELVNPPATILSIDK